MIAKLLGANWRTSVSGIGAAIFGLLTMVAALPYEMGDVANIFPPEWKAKIATASAIATLVLKWWNATAQKDKIVTGGTTQQTVSGAVADQGTQALVDATVTATIQSGESVTSAQRNAVQLPKNKVVNLDFPNG
jgi:hypothetical protein